MQLATPFRGKSLAATAVANLTQVGLLFVNCGFQFVNPFSLFREQFASLLIWDRISFV
jgi:hypothetical protein